MGKKFKWNFTKFLVDRSGKVVGRFAPMKTPEDAKKLFEIMQKLLKCF